MKKTRVWSCLKNCRGFTLLETVLSWVILSIIFLSFAILLQLMVKSFSKVDARKEALAHARVAMDRMMKEFMLLKPADILAISPTSILFLDSTGGTTDYHTADLGGATHLYRGADLLAKNLSSFNLNYYDSAGTPITNFGDVSSVRRINIEFYVAAKNGNGDVRVREDVYPRNFYYSGFQ